MSSRNQRLSTGVNSLVRRLLVNIPGEDPASANEREQNAIDFVREVLGRYEDTKVKYLNIIRRLTFVRLVQNPPLLLPI